MTGNTIVMILVLGGTLFVAFALLYFSLRETAPRRLRPRSREAAAATTAAMIAANSPSDRSDR